MTSATDLAAFAPLEGSVLTFVLGEEVCGVDLAAIVEVVEYQGVTRVPFSPEHVLGVFNLRGSVVAVVNLASRLGLASSSPSGRACVVIVSLPVDGEVARVGLLVDGVRTVVAHDPEKLDPAPHLGTRIPTEFLRGILGDADTHVLLLDLGRTLSLVEPGAGRGITPFAKGAAPHLESHREPT